MRTQEVFKALSDPTRREILKLLRSGSLSAGEIAEHFPITKGSLSHHFNVLKAAQLVRVERRGQSLVYSLDTTVFEDVAAMLLDLFPAPTPPKPAKSVRGELAVEPGPAAVPSPPIRRRRP